MARYRDVSVTLSAGQAAGTSPVLAAETGALGQRLAVILGNPGATACNVFLVSGGVAASGMPLAAGGLMAFDGALPGLNNDLYVVGLAAGDKLAIWVA